jgi:hypothetical protein
MKELSIVGLSVRLDGVRQSITEIDEDDLEKQEMSLLLKSNVDDLHSMLALCGEDQHSLGKISNVIAGIERGVQLLKT